MSAPASATASADAAAPASPGASQAAPAAAPSGELDISETAKGETLTVEVGATIRLILHNTYWNIEQGNPAAVLALAAAPVYSAAGAVACIPGTGCGTVTATFRALATGRAVISASRTSCGEALACTGGNGAFEVTVIVR